MSLEMRLRRRLAQLAERPFWQLQPGKPDFTSNDYLGLLHDDIIGRILREAPPALMRGSGASRYLGGDAAPFHEVEALAAQLWGHPSEKALFYPAGLTANLAFWSAIPQRDDIILFDREVHASIRQGIRLSGAAAWGFAHNDWEALEKKLRRCARPPFLVIESLYSMRGTMPDAAALRALAARYEFYLIVDEAHTTLILPGGRSWSDEAGVAPLARLFTFGKAGGLIGAVWVGASWLIEYLQRTGFAGIYTTALPPFLAWAIVQVLQRSPEWEPRRQRLQSLITTARALLEHANIPYHGLEGPIALLPATVGELPLKRLTPPTVASPAYRLSLHAHNTPEELRGLLGAGK